MTVPRERFRAIRLAREWLERIAQDPLMSAETRSTAASLLDVYPSDKQMRAVIDSKAIGLPPEISRPLGAASKWILAFRQDSDASALASVRRHLPTCAEIKGKLAVDLTCVFGDYPPPGVHDWLEPDEDYFEAVVKGWLDECVVAVAADYAEVEGARVLAQPWYLISASTSGVYFQDLELGQRVVCTVTRPSSGEEHEWRYVKSCEVRPASPGHAQ